MSQTGESETLRFRDARMSKEVALVRLGIFLASLGWDPRHVNIAFAKEAKEDSTALAIRTRLIEKQV
jgi:hypothetical protein